MKAWTYAYSQKHAHAHSHSPSHVAHFSAVPQESSEPLASRALQLTIQSPRIQQTGQAQLEGHSKMQVPVVIG